MSAMQVETVAMAGGLIIACFRLHGLYSGNADAGEHVNPVWPILFIVGDGFMLVSVLALAVTQGSQVSAPAPVVNAPNTVTARVFAPLWLLVLLLMMR